MKKFLAILLCLCTLLVFAACAEPAPEETPNNDKTPTATEAEYKLGMGIVVSTDDSETGNAQVDATVATVVTDADGKIVACRIDVAQNKMDVTDGTVDLEKTFKTKMEKGAEYGMAGKVDNDDNGVMLEWDAQAKAFEKYVVGKTGAEVAAMETQEKKGHMIAVDAALLEAGCSMQITDFMAAVDKACKDEQAVSFKTAATFTLGVAAKTTVDEEKSADATAEADGVVAMFTDFAASVVVDGKIVATLNDAIQPQIAITADGEIGDTDYKGTKRELKENYNMAKYGASMDWNEDGVVKEWYEQSAAFSAYVVGKTAAEVEAMATKTVESSGYVISADDALLSAGCTIQITGIKAVVAQSVTNAR